MCDTAKKVKEISFIICLHNNTMALIYYIKYNIVIRSYYTSIQRKIVAETLLKLIYYVMFEDHTATWVPYSVFLCPRATTILAHHILHQSSFSTTGVTVKVNIN